jgi:hypothetical protein
VNSGGLATNWATDNTGVTDAAATPGTGSTVNFSATGAGNFTNTLDAAFSIAGLNITNNVASAVTINPGTGGTLTIGSGGIDVQTGAPTPVTINAPVTLGAAQTWNVADAGVTLTLAGRLSGTGDLTKAGLGAVAFTNANDYTANLTITNGVLTSSSNTTPFGTGAGSILLGDTTASNNATLSYSGTATTISNALTVQAGSSGTLSILGVSNTHTFTGAMALNNNLTVDNNTAGKTTTFSGGVTQSASALAISKLAGAGAVTFSTSATSVGAGGLTLNTAGGGVLAFSGGFVGTGNLTLNNNGTTAAGLVLSTNSINHTGKITNSGSNAGTGTVTISGIIGSNVTGVYQNSATSNLSLSGANTFAYDGITNFGLNIQAGAVTALTSSSALGAGRVTLGDTSANANNASLLFGTNSLTFTNPIVLADRSTATGTLTIGIVVNTVGTVLSGGVTGNNDLTVNNSTTGVTGRPNFTALVNNAGTITLIGTNAGTTAATTFTGGIGSNVTGVIQNNPNSALTISGGLAVNASGTTLTNSVGPALLTASGGVTGTGNLILKNNSSTAAGITLSTTSVNNDGTITNSGTGSGGVSISAIIGTNVDQVIQNSATSSLTLGGVANAWTGGLTIKAGNVIGGSNANTFGGNTNVITLGDSSGSANATVTPFNSATYLQPITVASGNSGVATLMLGTTTGNPVWGGGNHTRQPRFGRR